MTAIVYIKMPVQVGAYLYSRFAPDALYGTPITIPKGTAVPWELKHTHMNKRECKIFGTLDSIFLRALTYNHDCEESSSLYANAFSLQAFNYAKHNRYRNGKHVPMREDLDRLVPVCLTLPSNKPYSLHQVVQMTFNDDYGKQFVDACTLMFKNSLHEYITLNKQNAQEDGKDFDFSECIQKYCVLHRFPANITENLRNYSYRWKFV